MYMNFLINFAHWNPEMGHVSRPRRAKIQRFPQRPENPWREWAADGGPAFVRYPDRGPSER
jgi:hypothetical protein